ncbi:PREDICTED: uncharacterized protein LOC106748719 [Dinoponera quadriceps]|uniref:Odorant receptor n=1 Tax=Dinoponera quadriceps TaxID=609295 RepID=A0A6P3XYM0_DINQU|nr:PREDICTED: uncharacterized protein LOC106748719 [Dinoponera quadriceps]
MDFRNVNPLNIRTNLISGNLLPLEPGDSRFSIGWKLFAVLMWLVQVIQVIVLIPGFFVVSREKALVDGTMNAVLSIEVFFNIGWIHAHRKLVDQLIQQVNNILCNEDEMMKSIVMSTLQPIKAPLRFYWVVGGLCVLLWSCIPLPLIFKKVSFRYEDYRMPAVFSKQPFSLSIFLMGSIFMIIGNTYVFLKKGGMDIYMIHFVLLITAQYRYIATKLTAIFRNAILQSDLEQCRPDQWVNKEIKALCRHYTSVLRLSSLLKQLLSLSFSMIYVNSVLRFCFIGVMLSTVNNTINTNHPRNIPSTTFLEGFLIFIYTCGSIVQFYVLCFCMQQLQDASKNMTNEAFHENWYRFGSSIKRTLMLMILGTNLDCKISTNDKLNLSLTSFMSILNQSYSILLVLL